VSARSDSRVLAGCGAAVVAAGAAGAAGAVYLNALHNPFVYDDLHTVVANPSILHLGDLRAIVLGALTRPVVNLSYAVDRAVWGPAPFGYHLTSVLLHMANVALLFVLARRLAPERAWTALAAAGLFAVHPMMTEAVGYISGRSELLCALFFLIGLLCGRKWIRAGGLRWAGLTVLAWLGMLASKEIGAMFPFVFLAYDRLFGDGTEEQRRRRIAAMHAPLLAVTVLAGIVRLLILVRIEHPGAIEVHWSYGLIAIDVAVRYLRLLLVPSGQTIFHSVPRIDTVFDPRVLAAGGVLLLIGGVCWRFRRRAPVVSFGLLWFLLLLVPSSVLMLLDQGEPMAEHRVYLASCGLFLAVGDGAARLGRWWESRTSFGRFAVPAAVVMILLSFAAETMVRNAVWRDPIALWNESVVLAPGHYRPHLLLGEALQDAGRNREALEQYQRATELRPADATGHVKLGQLLAGMGEFDKARGHFTLALALDKDNEAAQRGLKTLDEMTNTMGTRP
jgi:hypothetical protein